MTRPTETTEIIDPYPMNLDAEAAWLRGLPASAQIRAEYMVIGSRRWHSSGALSNFQRETLAQLLECFKNSCPQDQIRINQGTADKPDMQPVSLRDVLAIRIEVWS